MYVVEAGEWCGQDRVYSYWALPGTAAILASTGPPQTAPQNHYVDSRACAQCHSQIYESYRRTSMGRSLFQPASANTVEDYINKNTFDHALSGTHYSMTIRDGAYYQRRWQTGFDGSDTNIEDMKIDYVIGAGDHARSYLHRTALGTLIELPLGWYSERGGYWAMSPGFDSHHPRPGAWFPTNACSVTTGIRKARPRTRREVLTRFSRASCRKELIASDATAPGSGIFTRPKLRARSRQRSAPAS